MDENFEQVSRIVTMENFVVADFADKWKVAKRNAEFFSIRHWTEDEERKIRTQGRIPYRFDKTSHIMNLILGTQREGRADIQFLERKMEDAHRVDLLNASWKYFADLYGFPFVESDVCQDGVINQCGVFEVGIDKSEYYAGNLRVRRVPFDMCLWDTNSRNYDLSDALWYSRREFFTREALKAKFPDKAKLIDLTSFDASTQTQARPLKYVLWYDVDRQLIGIRNFYERQHKTKYLIWTIGSEEPEPTPYDSKGSAEYQIRDRLAKLRALNSEIIAQGGQPQPEPQFDTLSCEYPVIKKSVVMLNGVLEEEHEFPLGEFPYVNYFAYFNDGDFWTAMERMKDPQTFFNRMMAQADYSLGTQAKGFLRIDPSVPKNRAEEIRQNWGKTGGTGNAKAGQLELFEGRGPTPQIFTLVEQANEVMQDAFGGANFLGLKETASESGRAVMARQAQAGLDNFIILDNMRRTKTQLGKLIAWYLTNEITTARQLRITGEPMEIQEMVKNGILKQHPLRPNVGYAEINTDETTSIKEIEVDVVVGESPYSPTKLQAALAAMTDAFKSGFVPMPPPIDVAINMLPIPQQFKDSWLAMAQNQKPDVKTTLQISFKDLPPTVQNQVEAAILGVQPNPVENATIKASETLGNLPTPPKPATGATNA